MGRLVSGLSSPQECCKDKMSWTKELWERRSSINMRLLFLKTAGVFSVGRAERSRRDPGQFLCQDIWGEWPAPLIKCANCSTAKWDQTAEAMGLLRRLPSALPRAWVQDTTITGETWVLINLPGTHPGTHCKLPPFPNLFFHFQKVKCVLSPLDRVYRAEETHHLMLKNPLWRWSTVPL